MTKIQYDNADNKATRFFLGGVLLKPGVNELSDTQLNRIQKHPNYDRYLENKTIRVMGNEDLKTDEVEESPKPKRRRSPRKKKVEETEVKVDEL